MDTKLEKLNKLLEIIKDDTVKPSDIQKFLVVILDVIKKSKENFDNLSSENIKTIKDSISYLEENYKKWEITQDDKIKSILSGFDTKLSTIDTLSKELKKSIEEVKAIEVKDGEDADEEVIVAKVLKEIKLPEYKEVILDNGEEIVVKINDINSKEDKYKIDASHIKNLPTTIIQGSNISKSVYQLQDVKLTSLANNDTLKYNSTTQLWENGAGSGSSISLLTNGIPNASQTILNLVQGSNMTINDLGGGIIEFSAVVSPAGAPGEIQYYDSITGLTAGATGSFFDNTTGDYYLPNLAGVMNNSITKAVKFDATGLTSVKTITLPDATGTMVLSVNGTPPDSAGDVTIATGGSPGGSSTQLQYNNAGSFGGISGATTNGTSVTYTTGNLLVADVKASSSAGVQILGNSGTVTALFGAGGGANSTFYGGSKFDYATASTVPYFDASKNLISSSVTPTELGYLSGVTSAIQTQLNAKGTVTSVAGSGGTTGLSFSGSPITTSGTLTLTGTLIAANGGTGFATYAVGDLLYADTTTTLAKLADVAVGSYLRSGGVNTAPLWSTLKLPNTATVNRIPYASATDTWADSANFTFDGTSTLRWGTGKNGIVSRPNTSDSNNVAFYSTNVTPSNTNHSFLANGATTRINATSAGAIIFTIDAGAVLQVNQSSVVASKLMTVTDTVAGTALDVTNSTSSAAANGLRVTMSSSGHNAAQGIIVAKSTTSGGGNTLTMLDFQQNGQNATTSQEINHTYSLRDNSASRSAGAVSFKYSNTGSGTQVTDFIWRTLQGSTTLSDAIRIRGRHLEMLTGTATGVTVAINAGTATLSTGASDHVGKVTANNTGASTITITFGQAFTNAPSAFAYNETTTANVCTVVTTTTTLVITCTTVTGDKIAYGVLAS